jgi:hypothetical protein
MLLLHGTHNVEEFRPASAEYVPTGQGLGEMLLRGQYEPMGQISP